MPVRTLPHDDRTFVTKRGPPGSETAHLGPKKTESGLAVTTTAATTAAIVNRTQEKNTLHTELVAAREVYAEQSRKLDERQARLREQRAEFEEHKAKFQLFSQENNDKFGAANNRSQNHQLETATLDKEIADLTAELDALLKKKKLVTTTLTDAARHREYLKGVIAVAAAGDQHREVSDLLGRYDMLQLVRQDVGQVLNQNDADIAETKRDVERIQATRSDKKLVLQGEVQALNDELASLKAASAQLELKNQGEEEARMQRHAELGNAQFAIGNMYANLRRVIPGNKTVQEKLERIENEIQHIAWLLQTCGT